MKSELVARFSPGLTRDRHQTKFTSGPGPQLLDYSSRGALWQHRETWLKRGGGNAVLAAARAVRRGGVLNMADLSSPDGDPTVRTLLRRVLDTADSRTPRRRWSTQTTYVRLLPEQLE